MFGKYQITILYFCLLHFPVFLFVFFLMRFLFVRRPTFFLFYPSRSVFISLLYRQFLCKRLTLQTPFFFHLRPILLTYISPPFSSSYKTFFSLPSRISKTDFIHITQLRLEHFFFISKLYTGGLNNIGLDILRNTSKGNRKNKNKIKQNTFRKNKGFHVC